MTSFSTLIHTLEPRLHVAPIVRRRTTRAAHRRLRQLSQQRSTTPGKPCRRYRSTVVKDASLQTSTIRTVRFLLVSCGVSTAGT